MAMSRNAFLYMMWALGAEFLVKNKNGEVYFIDHGYSGKLIKTNERWEDAHYGFDDNIFEKSKFDYSIVSWEDREPLNIYEHLGRSGWLDSHQEYIERHE